MELTNEQDYAFNKYLNKENIFVTGPGGSGKSLFIKHIVEHADNNGIDIHVCAMTGCAAILLECGAKTLHSWGGFGLAKGDVNIISNTIADNKYKRKNWQKVKILIVDEISMLSYKLFELIDLTARKTRKNTTIFGGIQVIFCGDFFQLPPVSNYDDPLSSKFCFEHPLFDQVFPNNNKIEFTHIFRQKDPLYTKILNRIRIGKISTKNIITLQECIGKTYDPDHHIRPTIIHPLKNPVENINNESLERLSGEEHIFNMKYDLLDKDTLSSEQKEKCIYVTQKQIDIEYKMLENNINCLKSIKLKVGAQVMCIANLDLDKRDTPICNGSQGIIVNFNTETGNPIVKFNNGLVKHVPHHSWVSDNIPHLCISQIPLILAWAVTIHKVQGTTINLAEIDIGSGVFECGQTYVALSRVTDLNGLYLKSFNPSKIKVNTKVQKFYEKMASISNGKKEGKNDEKEIQKGKIPDMFKKFEYKG